MTNLWIAERKRFADVMAARKSAKELIALFDKLADSDKFMIMVKPYCFTDLIEVCSARVPASALDALLTAISLNWAGDAIWRIYSADEAALKVSGLVRKVVEASAKDDVLEKRLRDLKFSGVIKAWAQVPELCRLAGMPAAAVSTLEATLARLATRPPKIEVCPF